MATNEDGYLTTAEALAYLRTAPRTLYRFLAAGKIPALRLGHQWRFRKADLDRWVESRPRRLRPSQTSTPPAASHARTRRVLVAADEALVRDTLVSILAVAKYEVEVVSDGLAAIARLRTDPFDVEVAREATRFFPAIKVVIITADPSQSSAIGVNIGVDGYLTKPFRAIDLLMAVERALEPESILARSVHNNTEIEDAGSAVGSDPRSW
jgi:excisionase family DNA binding protein